MADSAAKQALIDQLTIKAGGFEIVSKAKATDIVNKLYAGVEEAAEAKVKPLVTKTILICAGLAVLPLIAVMMEKRSYKRSQQAALRPATAN